MKKLALIAAAAIAMGGAALAAPGDNPRRRAEYFTPEGHLMSVEMRDQHKAEQMLKNAQKLGPGTIIVTMDGNFYVLQDVKMPDGRMLHDSLAN